jgi:hypothetical protein
MISVSRLLPALFCALALVAGASPARSTVFTEFAPLVSPPVTVTSGSSLPVSFDFGQSFASISFAQFTLTFSGNLFDPDETWFLDKIGGQVNVSGASQSVRKFNPNSGNTAFYTDLLDGKFSDTLYTSDWYNTSSWNLASISLQIDAIPASVTEPASLALLAAGLASLAVVRRRRDPSGTLAG